MSTNFLHGFYLADFIMVIVAVLVGYVSGVLQHGFGHSSSTTVCVRPITFSCDIIDFTPENTCTVIFFCIIKNQSACISNLKPLQRSLAYLYHLSYKL